MESSRDPGAEATPPCGTPRQRQSKLRAASSRGQPRLIGGYVLPGRPCRACFATQVGGRSAPLTLTLTLTLTQVGGVRG